MTRQALASGVADLATIEVRLRRSLKAPICPWVIDGVKVANWNIDPEVVIYSARL